MVRRRRFDEDAVVNYRHAFHAGNHADVLKHVVLLALLQALKRKETPFFVLDTHAGRGMYSLLSDAADRTLEHESGIGRLWNQEAPEAVERLLSVVRACNEKKLAFYPGSPWIVRSSLRSDDRLAACELHPEESYELKRLFRNDPQVGAHERDGYQALKALLPPKERRGLVLVDPPYEAQEAELDIVLEALEMGLARWNTGVYAVWYPIKQRSKYVRFFRAVTRLPIKSALTAELIVRSEENPVGLNGSGVLILNPPYRIDEELRSVVPWLASALSGAAQNGRMEWLKREG